MERDYSVERFVTFADAVVAIAITLLALPLLELADESSRGPAEWWSASALPLLGLLLSFGVIARLWWAHHSVYARVVRLSRPLVLSTFVWLLTIVLVSIATAITTRVVPVGAGEDGRWAFALYVGVMIASGLTLFAQALIVQRDPGLVDHDDEAALARVVGAGAGETVIGFALALGIGLLLPVVNYAAFAVLLLTGRADRPVLRLLERRAARRRGVR